MTTRRPSKRLPSPVPGDVLFALSDLGIDVEKVQNDEAWACCPNHTERRASWSVNLDTGQHNCFSCGYNGGFSDLVRKINGGDDEAARSWIRAHGGIEASIRKFRGETVVQKKEADPVTEADLALFIDPPRNKRDDRDLSLSACREYGILWDPKEERWIFPIRDPYTGKLRGWQEKAQRYFNNYPANVEKSDTLFGFDAFCRNPVRTMIILESPLDAVRLRTYAWPGAVASFGVEVSDEQIRLVIENSRRSVWALDNDAAGDRISSKIRNQVLGQHRISFFNYAGVRDKDPGTMEAEDLDYAIRHAVPAYRARFDADR